MKAPRASAVSSGDEQDCAYTVERFAIKHAISRAQAYVEIAAGRLIGRKVGARTIITREDAAKWRRALPKISGKDAPNIRGASSDLPAWPSGHPGRVCEQKLPTDRRSRPREQEDAQNAAEGAHSEAFDAPIGNSP